MGWYIFRRLLQLIPVYFLATLLLYFLVFKLNGDPLAALAGNRGMDPGVKAALAKQYYLDQPFFVQYWHYLSGTFHFDFGTSFSGRPIRDELKEAFPVTARLALLAVALETVFGVVFGAIAGWRKGKLFDASVMLVSLALIAIPVFVIGFFAQFFLGVKWGLAPITVGGNVSFQSLLLPAVVLATTSFAFVVRLVRNSVSEALEADHVRTATAKGIPGLRVFIVHVLRNSLVPVVTYLGVDIGGLMAGAVVTEGIFNIQGVGGKVFTAITSGQAPVVVSFITVMVIIFLFANLLVDVLYALLDPRIRYGK